MGIIGRVGNSIAAWQRSTTVTVAVAGLARSGKTVFITSVVANLQAAARTPRGAMWLQGLQVVAEKRLCSAEQPPNYRPRHGRLLPYGEMLAALTADTPRWPSRTADIYETALDIKFWPNKAPDAENGLDKATACVRLIIVDYPGEWLVDVPMLGQTYSQWSETVLNRLQRAPWSEVSADFQKRLADTEWAGGDNNDVTRHAAREWQRVLVAARGLGLKWLQPAHFVRERGQTDEAAVPSLDQERLWFCPLPDAVIAAAKKGTLARAMAERYVAYQKETGKFFGDTLKDATHHVLLVDVLEALAEGEHAFHESAAVLAAVYRVFVQETSYFRKKLGLAGLQRVVLVATKADTAPPSQRAALQSLLTDMCSGRLAGAADIPPPVTDHLAAVRATADVDAVVGGETVRVVQGLCSETGKLHRIVMIDIPDQMPLPDYFRRRQGLRATRFRPAPIDGGGDYGVPNVRLGQALNKLLGETLK